MTLKFLSLSLSLSQAGVTVHMNHFCSVLIATMAGDLGLSIVASILFLYYIVA